MKQRRQWVRERARGVGLVTLLAACVCAVALGIVALLLLVMT